MFGVYVHVPFCASRCDYCDFATWTDRAHLVDDYVDACVVDIGARLGGSAGDARGAGPPAATSVFFGGGTPSLLPASDLLRILDAVRRAPDAEVTVECNPDSVDVAKLRAYRAGGVTRLSFGVQSMRPHVLAALGRTHDPANVARALEWARAAGFETFNLDLVFGAAGESVSDWEATLRDALALHPPHISAYALSVEPGTGLARRIGAGEIAAPDDDDQATKFDIADAMLTDAGLAWYEISNWARPGHECRHNLCYWSQGDYAGIGCAAHGHTSGRRSWTVRTPERYIERVRDGRSPEAGYECLDAATRTHERLALMLRTRDGIVAPPSAAHEVGGLVDVGLLAWTGDGRVVLTRMGRRLANEVVTRVCFGTGTPAPRPPSTRSDSAPRPVDLVGTR